MIQLFPPPGNNHDEADFDAMAAVGAERRESTGERPWIFTNMISSADGATAVDGLSGQLGGDGDRTMFRALRSQADVVLVGAGTARQEMYRPPIAYESAQAQRQARGQAPRARLALVTRRLDLDPGLPFFEDSDADTRPFVITTAEALAADTSNLSDRAEVLVAGTNSVDLEQAVIELRSRGTGTILCEGGPSLNGQLIADGLVDEWNLTIAPLLVSGDSKRAAVGPLAGGPPPAMRLSRVWSGESYLFCRWIRADG